MRACKDSLVASHSPSSSAARCSAARGLSDALLVRELLAEHQGLRLGLGETVVASRDSLVGFNNPGLELGDPGLELGGPGFDLPRPGLRFLRADFDLSCASIQLL